MKIKTRYTKLIIITIFNFLTVGCENEVDRKIIQSENKKHNLTLLYFKNYNKTYLINELYKYDSVPKNNYILNNHYVLENFVGLVEWKDSITTIYIQYGEFDTINAGENFKIKRISTKKFEEMKKDSLHYKYFYH